MKYCCTPAFVLLAVLAAVAWQGKPLSEENMSKMTTTMSNGKQLGLGLAMYLGDYDDVMPYPQRTATVMGILQPYLKNNSVTKTLNPNGGEFLFNMAIGGVKESNLKDPTTTPTFFESKQWPDGSRVVVFVDAHVKAVSGESWPAIDKALKRKFPRTAKKPLPANWGTKP